MPRLRFALAGLLLAALAARPGRAQSWTGGESLEVRVEDPKGKSVANAEVVLAPAAAAAGIRFAPALTDAHGRAAIGGLASGSWELEVRRPGFMTYAAEIVLGEGKPVVLSAAHRNVPGATATLRVRLGRAPGAPALRPVVGELPIAIPPPPRVAVAAAPSPAPPAPSPVAPAPATPASRPVPAGAAPEREPPTLAPPAAIPVAPIAASRAPAVQAAPPSLPDLSGRVVPQEAVPSIAAPGPASVPAAPPVPAIAVQAVPSGSEPSAVSAAAGAASTAAPPPRGRVAAVAVARNCFECRPGESARGLDAVVAAGGERCPADLRARVTATAPEGWSRLGSALPAGCALLVVEISPSERYTGFRYEASAPAGRPDDCRPGQECAAGACRFLGDPILRQEQGKTFVAALFESDQERAASFVVYTRPAR